MKVVGSDAVMMSGSIKIVPEKGGAARRLWLARESSHIKNSTRLFIRTFIEDFSGVTRKRGERRQEIQFLARQPPFLPSDLAKGGVRFRAGKWMGQFAEKPGVNE